MAFLSHRLAYASIRQYLAVLRYISLEAGLPNPLGDDWHLSSVLKGLKRELGARVIRKSPVTPELLLRLCGALSPSSSLDRAVWTACLLMFFTLLLVLPPSHKGFLPLKHRTRTDFTKPDPLAPPGLNLTVKWSKTIQFGDRKAVFPLPLLAPHPLCPVSALHTAFGNDPIPLRDGPAFWVARDDVWSPLLYKSALRQVGLDPNLFAAHSFRRGGATRAFAMGLPGELIRVMGDWRSDAYQGYLDFPLQTRVQAMAAFVSDLPTSY